MDKDQINAKLERLESLLVFNKPILTVEELHVYTGIAVSQIYKLTSRKEIPHSKPTGKKLFFEKEKIDAWLLSNPIKTDSDVKAEAVNYIVNNPKSL